MRVRLAVAALVNNVCTNVQTNMAAWGGGEAALTWAYFLTNHKLSSIHSGSVQRSRSKATKS